MILHCGYNNRVGLRITETNGVLGARLGWRIVGARGWERSMNWWFVS